MPGKMALAPAPEYAFFFCVQDGAGMVGYMV